MSRQWGTRVIPRFGIQLPPNVSTVMEAYDFPSQTMEVLKLAGGFACTLSNRDIIFCSSPCQQDAWTEQRDLVDRNTHSVIVNDLTLSSDVDD